MVGSIYFNLSDDLNISVFKYVSECFDDDYRDFFLLSKDCLMKFDFMFDDF